MSTIEQIMAQLRAKGLVRGVRGPGGGYKLTRQPSDITVREIMDAVHQDDTVSFPNLMNKLNEITLNNLVVDDETKNPLIDKVLGAAT